MKRITYLLSILLLISPGAFARTAEVLPANFQVNAMVLLNIECEHGVATGFQLKNSNHLQIEIADGNDQYPNRDAIYKVEQFSITALDGMDINLYLSGQIVSFLNRGQNVKLGSIDESSLNLSCTRAGNKPTVAYGLLKLDQEAHIQISRTVSACSNWWGIIPHREAHLDIAFNVIINTPQANAIFSPNLESTFFAPALTDQYIFSDKQTCENWKSAWK